MSFHYRMLEEPRLTWKSSIFPSHLVTKVIEEEEAVVAVEHLEEVDLEEDLEAMTEVDRARFMYLKLIMKTSLHWEVDKVFIIH